MSQCVVWLLDSPVMDKLEKENVWYVRKYALLSSRPKMPTVFGRWLEWKEQRIKG